MNKTITFCTKNVRSLAVFAVIAIGLVFVVLPILSPHIANAQEDDGSGFSFGDVGVGCCESFDDGSGFSFGEAGWYTPTPVTDDGSGFSFGEAGPGCCDTYTLTSQDDGSGFSFGEAGPGCCDVIEAVPAPVEYRVITEYEYQPVPEGSAIAYEYEPTNYGYIGGGYSYGGGLSYSSASYGYTSTPYSYATPTYTTQNYDYTQSPVRQNPRCTLTASDTSINDGDDVTLRWTTDNATSVSINGGIGSVALDGSRVVSPDSDETYVLIATGPGGSAYCSETVTVDEEDDDNDNVRCDSFTVNDSRVDEGDRITLTWRTTGADDVRINNGVGDVDDDGSERVTVDEDTTFTLTARNGNDTDTCRVTVEVDEDKDKDTKDIPRCELSISDTRINSGKQITLSWDNLRTDRVVLKDNHGKKILDSDDDKKIDEDKDSITVRPTQDTEFTLTAYNGSTKRTCTVSVDVNDGVAITSVRSQDTISLSEVPYTGFEAGPVLTMIFYGMIVVWALVLGYILVFKNKTTPVVAQGHTLHVLAAAPTTVTAEPVHTYEIREVDTVPANLPTEEVTELAFVTTEDSIHELEAHAHANATLISSDALRFIEGQGGSKEDQIATLDRVIALAKAQFPKENEWTIINKERIISLLG